MAEKINKSGFTLNKTWRDLLFCLVLLLIPTVQFCIFYIAVNFNSFLLSFQKVDISTGVRVVTTDFSYFVENLKGLSNDFFKSQYFKNYLGNSILYWAAGTVIGTPLGLLFSYYISKKYFGSSFFRVVLYLPSIISGFILVIFYSGFGNNAFTEWIGAETAILSKSAPLLQKTLLIVFFNLWVSFGTSVLLYSNAMSGISPEVLESASLDGAKGFKEFWYIILPSVFSTFSVFFVTSIAMIFINQANLYSFYNYNCQPEMKTIGYYMFSRVADKSGKSYGEMSLLGIMLSAIVIPVTFAVRKLFEKYGPSDK